LFYQYESWSNTCSNKSFVSNEWVCKWTWLLNTKCCWTNQPNNWEAGKVGLGNLAVVRVQGQVHQVWQPTQLGRSLLKAVRQTHLLTQTWLQKQLLDDAHLAQTQPWNHLYVCGGNWKWALLLAGLWQRILLALQTHPEEVRLQQTELGADRQSRPWPACAHDCQQSTPAHCHRRNTYVPNRAETTRTQGRSTQEWTSRPKLKRTLTPLLF